MKNLDYGLIVLYSPSYSLQDVFHSSNTGQWTLSYYHDLLQFTKLFELSLYFVLIFKADGRNGKKGLWLLSGNL